MQLIPSLILAILHEVLQIAWVKLLIINKLSLTKGLVYNKDVQNILVYFKNVLKPIVNYILLESRFTKNFI